MNLDHVWFWSISYSESWVQSYDQLFSWPPLGSTYDHPTSSYCASTHQQFEARAFWNQGVVSARKLGNLESHGIPSCLKGSVARARVSKTCNILQSFWWPFQSSSSWCSHFDPFFMPDFHPRSCDLLAMSSLGPSVGASRSSCSGYDPGHGDDDVGNVSFDRLEDEADDENLKPIWNSFSSWTEPPDESNDPSPTAREFEPNRLTHESYTDDLTRFLKLVQHKQPEFRQLVKLRRQKSGFQEEPTILIAIGSLCRCLSEAFFLQSIKTQPEQVENLAWLKRIDPTRWMI